MAKRDNNDPAKGLKIDENGRISAAELLEALREAAKVREFISLAEAAEYLGVTKTYLYGVCADRLLPCYKPSGKLIFFKRSELDAWITSNRVATAGELNGQALRATL